MANLFQVIEWYDSTGQEMVHRLPESGSGEYKLGDQLRVQESQVAVIFRDGKALDVFQAGAHTLATGNLPFLTGLLGKAFDGRSPFRVAIVFVNLREFIDQKWGTPEPIVFRDADLGMVRLRAFGTYSMQISDPSLFVNKVVGSQGLYGTSDIQNFLRSIILSKLMDALGESKKGLFDLPSSYVELGAAAKAISQDDFAALGIALKTFYITAITPTEETAKAIDERAAMGAIGNMQAYMQFKAARALGDMATRPGGGTGGDMAGMGVGLGAGVGLGGMMAGVMQQAMQSGAQVGQQTPVAATVACANCHAQAPQGTKFCPNCGNKMSATAACPNCQAEVPAGVKFCPNCGNKM